VLGRCRMGDGRQCGWGRMLARSFGSLFIFFLLIFLGSYQYYSPFSRPFLVVLEVVVFIEFSLVSWLRVWVPILLFAVLIQLSVCLAVLHPPKTSITSQPSTPALPPPIHGWLGVGPLTPLSLSSPASRAAPVDHSSFFFFLCDCERFATQIRREAGGDPLGRNRRIDRV